MSDDVLSSYGKAIIRLDDILKQPESEYIRDAAIKRFEFCFELAWKAVQKTLRKLSLDCASPKICFKESFKQGWMENENNWIAILSDRNLTTHTYDEELAKQVYSRLSDYVEVFSYLYKQLSSIE